MTERSTKTPTSPAQAEAGEPAALPGIDMADALARLGGNRALLDKVYLDFRRQYTDSAAVIGQQVAAGATAEAAALAHAVKGVAGNIGAKRIFAAARAIEADLLQGGDAAGLLEALQAALDELLPVEAVERPVVPDGPGGIDREAFGRTVAALRELLLSRDLDADECLIELKALCPGAALREPLAQLGAAVDTLDFEAALTRLAQLERAAGL